jgi:WD40 repeat protein
LLRTFGPDDPETEDVAEGHSVSVLDAAISPDGTRALSAAFDNTLRLWDAETGEMLRVFAPDNPDTAAIEGHGLFGDSESQRGVWAVTFGPDGKTAYSAGFDSHVIRWDVETGETIRVYSGHEWGIFDIELTADGSRFVTASWDETLKLWDVETGEVLRTYEGHTDWVWNVALSPDEKMLLSAGADKILILWDLETGEEIRRFVGHDDGALDVTFDRTGERAISGGRENYAILWDVESGELLRRYVGHINWIRGLDDSPVDSIFATASSDGTIRLWPVQTFDQLIEWTEQNRYVRELTCPERKLYRVQPYCNEPSEDATGEDESG